MQKAFEKIIERLEEREVQAYAKTDGGATYTAYRNAIEIVDQVAEEYKSTDYINCSTDDLISRSDLLDAMDKRYKEKEGNVPDNLAEGFMQMEKLIKEQPSVSTNDAWIPCAERLPEKHKLYDITTKNEKGIHSDSAIFNPFIQRWLWDADETELVEIEVLAWAEKREPYQPKVCVNTECCYNQNAECPAAEGCAGFEEE